MPNILKEQLLWAIKNNKLGHVVQCIEQGADVNAANKKGITLVQIASYYGHTEIIKLLIEKGVKVNTPGKDQVTPLYWASHNGQTEAAKLLIEKGANVNIATNCHQETALHSASNNGHTETVKLLIEKGAEVNATDNVQEVPLLLASYKGHTETVKLLIEKGANVNAANNDGITPLHWASNNGHTEIAKLLIWNLLSKDPKMEKFEFLRNINIKGSLSSYGDELKKIGQISKSLLDYSKYLSSIKPDVKISKKIDKINELVKSIQKNDGSFQALFKNPSTKEILCKHRSNVFIRILSAFRCILTLGLVSKWSLLASRGEQVYSGIKSNYSATFFLLVEDEKNITAQKHPTLGNS